MLKHKGYTGFVKYDDEARILHGEVVGLKAVITFQGTTIDDVEEAFKDSVDDYLDWCEKRNKPPEKSHSGKFNLRMPPDLHAKVEAMAAKEGISMNSYIVNRL